MSNSPRVANAIRIVRAMAEMRARNSSDDELEIRINCFFEEFNRSQLPDFNFLRSVTDNERENELRLDLDAAFQSDPEIVKEILQVLCETYALERIRRMIARSQI